MNARTYSLPSTQLVSRWSIVAISGSVFVYGIFWHNAVLLGVGAVLLCFLLRRAWDDSVADTARHARRQNHRNSTTHSPRVARDQEGTTVEDSASGPSEELVRRILPPKSTDALVEDLLANGRYALMLRPETKQHLSQAQLMRAIRQLDEAMALVPGGRVLVGQLAEISNSACGQSEIDPKLTRRNLVAVSSIYLDRFCVTNSEYQKFVDSGGYEQLEFWHEEALPALLDFVDQTGIPGPRLWADGQYPQDDPHLPVVGVSWFEAWAYARWVGKQLPSDAEWTKAAAWPVESAPGRIAQRRYPWGESFDVRRAHLYGSGHNAPVPVDEFPGGTSVGGIHQLIGNVWEWTSTPLADAADPTLHVSESVMSVRGGAFDTYFENQATCHFQSGEQALARRRNIGFRLAIPLSALEAPNNSEESDNQQQEKEPQNSDAELELTTT